MLAINICTGDDLEAGGSTDMLASAVSCKKMLFVKMGEFRGQAGILLHLPSM
jgi:hypothetical protein